MINFFKKIKTLIVVFIDNHIGVLIISQDGAHRALLETPSLVFAAAGLPSKSWDG